MAGFITLAALTLAGCSGSGSPGQGAAAEPGTSPAQAAGPSRAPAVPSGSASSESGASSSPSADESPFDRDPANRPPAGATTEEKLAWAAARMKAIAESRGPDPDFVPWQGPPAPAKPLIPLCPGLTIVTAISSNGDYESIKTVESETADAIRIRYTSEYMAPLWNDPSPTLQRTLTHRRVLKRDLETADKYAQTFVGTERASETAEGTTAIGTSAAVLRNLKMKGRADLSTCVSAGDMMVRQGSDGTDRPVPGGCLQFSNPHELKRVGTTPVPMRVLVDGRPVDLPTVHAQTRDVEFYFLDDERNPITLAFRLGIGRVPALTPQIRKMCEDSIRNKSGLTLAGDEPYDCDKPNGGDRDVLRVVKITTACANPDVPKDGGGAGGGGGRAGSGAGGQGSAIERSLAAGEPADVYSIYFTFNSDAIREESEPTLKEIADVMRRHPDWKLRIAGHTDAIGGDAANLELSKRRSEAVKKALVSRYSIAAARLDTTGFGRSQPKDTNDTLEGRARNRRVELTRR